VAVVVVLERVKMYVLAGRTVGPEVVIVIVGVCVEVMEKWFGKE